MMDNEVMDWEDFDCDDYLPFAKWQQTKTVFDIYGQDSRIIFCKIRSKPIKFTNKFGKEQFKVEIIQWIQHLDSNNLEIYLKNDTNTYLAGGIRLMTALKKFISENQKDTMKITRVGKGFDTEYFIRDWTPSVQLNIDANHEKQKTEASTPKTQTKKTNKKK